MKIEGQLEKKRNQTAQRLEDIEFPFGKIPIGLNQSVSLFSLGLGIGFLIWMNRPFVIAGSIYRELTLYGRTSPSPAFNNRNTILLHAGHTQTI